MVKNSPQHRMFVAESLNQLPGMFKFFSILSLFPSGRHQLARLRTFANPHGVSKQQQAGVSSPNVHVLD